MNKRLFVSVVVLVSLLSTLQGQQPAQRPAPSPPPFRTPPTQSQGAPREEDQDVVRITSNLVQVDAVVTKDGKQVTDLKADDFEIFEDGKPQLITQFAYVSNVPAFAAIPSPMASRPADRNGPPVVPTKVRPNEVRRTAVLVVDDLGISAESVPIVRQQLRKFVDEQLQPNDLVSIVTTGGSEVGALQQFTTDKRLLNSAVERLRWNPCSRAGRSIFNPVGRISEPAICSWDTMGRTLQVLRFVLQGMRDLPGRKSMVLFSESTPIEEQEMEVFGGPLDAKTDFQGVGNTSQQNNDPGIGNQLDAQTPAAAMTAQLHKVAELAIRSSVVIYAVDTRGLQPTGATAADNFPNASLRDRQGQMTSLLNFRSDKLLKDREGGQLIARETGGFAVYNSNNFGLQRVLDDQRGYYLIGYRPREETFNRRFHHIKVRAKGSGLEVRTRKGFYGISEEAANPPELTARDNMNKALLSPFGASDLNVRLTTIFVNDPTNGPLLRSFLFLNGRDLVFTALPEDIHEARFDLSTIIYGDYGKIVNRQDGPVRLRLRRERYDQVLRQGIVYKFDTPVKQFGTFQFRIALRDTASSRIGAAGQFIEVPNLGKGQLALAGIQVSAAGSASDEVSKGPAVRRFPEGSPLTLAYAVYNAVADKNTHLPQLTAQTCIYQDGKAIYSGKAMPLDVAGQPDLQRIAAAMQLDSGSLGPGEYVLQIIVNDLLAPEKQGTASQWIDFVIAK